MKRLFAQYFEITFWVGAMGLLAVFPVAGDFSFCPLQALGISWCPGCGLGRSIHLAFYGDFITSLQMHPMGIPAIVIIMRRIIILFKNNLITNKQTTNEPCSPEIFI